MGRISRYNRGLSLSEVAGYGFAYNPPYSPFALVTKGGIIESVFEMCE
jgi:hypothetical protein